MGGMGRDHSHQPRKPGQVLQAYKHQAVPTQLEVEACEDGPLPSSADQGV